MFLRFYAVTRIVQEILLLCGLDNETATVRGFFVISKKLTKIWIWFLSLSFWEYRILWQKQEVCFENEFSVSRVFNDSSIIVRKILERAFIPSDVSPFINSKFFSIIIFSTFSSPRNFELFFWMILTRYGF